MWLKLAVAKLAEVVWLGATFALRWRITVAVWTRRRLGLLPSLAVMLLGTEGISADSTSLEAFQKHISTIPPAFEVEFEEGDLNSTAEQQIEALKSQGRQVFMRRQQ